MLVLGEDGRARQRPWRSVKDIPSEDVQETELKDAVDRLGACETGAGLLERREKGTLRENEASSELEASELEASELERRQCVAHPSAASEEGRASPSRLFKRGG